MSGLAAHGADYAGFIWGAYGAAALAFAWMTLDTLIGARRWRRRARALEKDDAP